MLASPSSYVTFPRKEVALLGTSTAGHAVGVTPLNLKEDKRRTTLDIIV